MGFFKEFKDDLSQAVNELMPGEDSLEETGKQEDLVVNTLEDEVDVESELSKLDGLLEQVTKKEPVKEAKPAPAVAKPAPTPAPTRPAPAAATNTPEPVMPAAAKENITIQEERTMADSTITPTPAPTPVMQTKEISDEVSVITEGTVIRGDIISNGSVDVCGQVEGNIECNGKLVVTGMVNGNSNSSEFFADAAQIEGEVVSSGTVKIGLGSVIIGNVTSTSAVIAGAIKGDIDVQGPVVVDTSAVVMGNIKSRSVQINNGAVIEGFCSQCYSDVDVQSLFDEKKGN